MYTLESVQRIPAPLDEVWDFISSPANLKEITPGYMGFDIVTPNLPKKMYAGMLIEYRVRPVLGIPLRWVTEITQVSEREYFVDEQRVGPYQMWHHEHWLTEIEGGVEMRDLINYKPPLGILGDLAQAVFIKKQLQVIFDFRWRAVEQRFGVFNGDKT